MALDPAEAMAKSLPSLSATLNRAAAETRHHHARMIRAAGERAELAVQHGRTSWSLGTVLSTFIFQCAHLVDEFGVEDENNRIIIVTPNGRVAVTKNLVIEDERGAPDQGVLDLRVVRDANPDWRLSVRLRRPSTDMLIVPPGNRTLRDNGWSCTSERALPLPAVDLDDPLHIFDYVSQAVIRDIRCPGRILPVFDRDVALGERPRLISAPLDAFGRPWASNE